MRLTWGRLLVGVGIQCGFVVATAITESAWYSVAGVVVGVATVAGFLRTMF